MSSQYKIFCRRCTECQKCKKIKIKYGHLPPKNVGTLTPWETVHIDLVGPYSLTEKQYHPDGSIQSKELQLTCMTMLDPVTGWFEIVEVPNYIVVDVKNKMDHQQLIDKSSTRISRLFDQTWLA